MVCPSTLQVGGATCSLNAHGFPGTHLELLVNNNRSVK